MDEEKRHVEFLPQQCVDDGARFPFVRIEVEPHVWSLFSFFVHVDAKVPHFVVSYRIEAEPVA